MTVSLNTEKRRSSNWYVILFTQCTAQVLVNKWWQTSVSTAATFCGTLQESTHVPRHTHTHTHTVRLHDFRHPLRCKWGPRSFKTLRSLDLYLVIVISNIISVPSSMVKQSKKMDDLRQALFWIWKFERKQFLISVQTFTNSLNHGADICTNFSFSGFYINLWEDQLTRFSRA